MFDRLKKPLSVILTILFLLCVITISGLQTNWFRYPASLEAFAVLIPLALSTVLVFIFFILFFLGGGIPQHFWWEMISGVLGIIVALCMTKVSQGVYFPDWYLDDIVANAPQKLSAENGELSYCLQIINPFASSHKEFLILDDNRRITRIPVPLFASGKPRHGFVISNTPTDWCTLEKTGDPNILVLHVTSFLRKSSFRINLTNLHAEEIN